MSNSIIESQGTQDQEIMSDMDSAFDSEGSDDQEFNFNLSHTLTCLQLVNEDKELFKGEKGEAFKQMSHQMVNFYQENKEYFDEIIVKDQNEKRERDRVEWNDWNPEDLVSTFQKTNELQVSEEEVSYQEEEEEKEYMVTIISEAEIAEREQAKAKELEETIVINDIYRQKTFNQADSNFNAAEILAEHPESQSQAMFYYQQAAELYIKGAFLCRNENVTANVDYNTLHHSHKLATIAHALTLNNDIAFQSEVSSFENIGRQGDDKRPLCVRARYLDIKPHNHQEQEPCALFQDSHLKAARAGVIEIATYCYNIHEKLISTRGTFQQINVAVEEEPYVEEEEEKEDIVIIMNEVAIAEQEQEKAKIWQGEENKSNSNCQMMMYIYIFFFLICVFNLL